MTELFKFMGEHPFLTFFICWLIVGLLALPFRIINELIRHMNIRKAGWPPAHLDTDGNVVKKEKDLTGNPQEKGC